MMTAINIKSHTLAGYLVGVVMLTSSFAVLAETGLDSASQTKVNSAKAKGWAKSAETKKSGYEAMNDKRLVNIGSKRAGTCTVNVGTAKSGEKAPKEIIVTTKEVINICK